MEFAVTAESTHSPAAPGLAGVCGVCNTTVIQRCGEIIARHWAHHDPNRDGCDAFSEGETLWHRGMKLPFPESCREVVIDENGVRHRADVRLPGGLVVEFQHSAISVNDLREREAFYRRMVWVFDASGPFAEGRIVIKKDHGHLSQMTWSRPRSSAAFCLCPVAFDLGERGVFLANTFTADGVGVGAILPAHEFVATLIAADASPRGRLKEKTMSRGTTVFGPWGWVTA